MRSRFAYFRPNTLGEALEFLADYGANSAVLAGGTDLSIKIREGSLAADHVIDVSRLDELRKIEITSAGLTIGAAVTYTEIINDPIVKQNAPVLKAASQSVGSLQIRNVGTLGGNVANASPAADSIPALMIHNAVATILSPSATKTEALPDIVVAPYKTTLGSGDLITEFQLEPLPDYSFSFKRVARRKSLSIARMNIAVVGKLDEKGAVTDVRISVGSVTPEPSRMAKAESILLGKIPDLQLFMDSAAIISSGMIARSGIRPSTEYKKPAIEGLVVKALFETFMSDEVVQR